MSFGFIFMMIILPFLIIIAAIMLAKTTNAS